VLVGKEKIKKSKRREKSDDMDSKTETVNKTSNKKHLKANAPERSGRATSKEEPNTRKENHKGVSQESYLKSPRL